MKTKIPLNVGVAIIFLALVVLGCAVVMPMATFGMLLVLGVFYSVFTIVNHFMD